MSRVHSPILHFVVQARSVRRLIGTAVLCLALFTGAPTRAANDAPQSPAGEVERSLHDADSEGNDASMDQARTKPKPRSTSKKTHPRRKPTRKSTSGDKSSRRPTAKGKDAKGKEKKTPDIESPKTDAVDHPVDDEINAAYEQMLKPAEERRYSISIDEGTYADLLDAFSRMSGLAILGDPPNGPVTYASTEEMDYKTALSEMRKILFNHPENFYIQREGNSWQVLRATEIPRVISPAQIYTSVQTFQDADLDEMEFVMVLYTPERGRVADLEPLRDFMPDYVRIAPYRDKNAVTVLALARDVRKYLDLVGIFEGAKDDPRELEAILIQHLSPSDAMIMLYQFLPALGRPSTAGASRKSKSKARRDQGSLAGIKEHGVDLIPYDEIETLFVRAMPDKIAEVKKYLAIIDVPHGPGDNPIIISLEHTRVGQLIALLRPLYGGSSSPSSSSKKKRKRTTSTSASAIVTPSIKIHTNPANNTLIVMGDEEELTKLRMYVGLFDIPSDNTTVRIPVENTDAGALIPSIEQIAGVLRPGGATSLVFQVDPAGTGLIVSGNRKDIELVEGIVADLDKPPAGGAPTPHLYECRHASPSSLIGLLNSLDRESATVMSPSKKKGKRSSKKRASSGTKYHGDDATGSLYIICNVTEWEEHYLPLLEMLDRATEREFNIVPVENADPAVIINAVTQVLAPNEKGRGARLTMLPHPKGILVFGATESDMADMRKLVAEFDLDPQIERKTFTLRYADPAEVKRILESLVVQSAGGGPRPKSGKKGKRKATTATQGIPVRIIESGRNDLIIQASKEEMAEIAELIAELDVDPLNMIVRVYEFAPTVDVGEIARTLSSFYPGSTSVPVGASKGGGKKPKRGLQKTQPGDLRFIPHTSAHKILVSAPAEMFDDIEEKIEMLRPADVLTGPAVEFLAVHDLDPETVADVLEPLLEVKYQELVDQGVILPRAPAKGKGPAPAPVSVMPDPRGDRVIVVVPPPMMDHVRALIDKIDRPNRERVVKTITLEKADPAEMVTAIGAMLASRPAPASPRPKGKKGGKSSPRRSTRGGDENVTIVTAPGGSAVVLTGYEKDVAEVEEWIAELDEVAKGGRMIKVYNPENLDVEKFADMIMNLLDSGGGKKPPKAKGGDGLFDFDFGFSGGPRRGKEIYLVTDTWAGTMVVSATPPKIREIDDLYAMYEGGPDGEEPVITASEPQPYETYALVHRDDAYEAVYDLEMIIDALWPDPENKPKIDYIPFTSILTIRGRPDDFDTVKDMIVEYVDKPSDKPVDKGFEVVQVKGMTATDMARMLQSRVGTDKVQILGLTTEDQDYLDKVEQIKPCVLPISAVQWMSVAVADLADESEEEPKKDELSSPEFDEKTKAKEEMLRSLSDQPADAEIEPIITIAPDDERGVVIIKGSTQEVADLKYVIEKILEELEDVPQPPDIRVFRLKYVDVSTAVTILEAMFNAPRQRLTAQQRRAMQQAQRRQQQQGKEQPGAEEGDRKGRRQREQEQPQLPVPQPTTGQIRIHPDSRTRTIIVRAAPEQYPAILKLLATIDKKGTAADFRIYALTRLNAAEVEATLKEMLGVGKSSRATRRQPTRRPGRRTTPQQQAQQQLELAGLEGESIKGQVTISSSAATNTIMAMAPEKTLDLIGQLIEELEDQETPERVTETYALKHGEATEVVAQLKELFGGGKGRRAGKSGVQGFDPLDVNNPTFIADTRTNSVIVRALEPDLPKITPMIEQFDQESQDTKPKYIQLQYAKPSEIAKKLQEAFASQQRGRRGGGKSKVQITGDDGSMKLIIIAPADVFADIQDMVAHVDVQQTNLDFRVYALTHARAPEVLKQMTDLVRALMQRGKQGGVDLGVFSAVADEKTNSLVVAGEPTIFPIVESLLAKIDIVPPEPVAPETRIYRLVSANAQEVANTINRLLGQKRGRSGEAPRAEANPTTNTVIVRATKKEQNEIWEQVIKPLDEFAEGQVQEIHQLQHAQASEVANIVNQMVRGQRRGQLAVTVVANDPLNQLVITGNGKDVEKVLPLIAELDHEPLETSQLFVEVYEVKYVDPNSLIGTINNAFPRVRGTRPEDYVRASYAWGTSSLVVSASQENHAKIKELIEKVDVESAVQRTTHVVKLTAANAEDLARQLTQVFQRTRRRRRDDVGMSITANPASNSLVVYANETELAEVQELVGILDVRPEEQREIRSFKLNYAECWELYEATRQFFSGGRGRRVSPRDQVDVYPNSASNTLVVTASAENMERIAEFIAEVDKPGAGDRTVTVVEVENADAASVTRALSDMFVRGRTTRRGQQTISITNPQGSSTLLIRANEKELTEIQAVLDQIEATGVAAGGGLKIIQLKYTDPEETRIILEEYLRKPGTRGGGRGGTSQLVGDVRLSVSTQNNALILSGDAEQLEEIATVVAQIDVETEDGCNVPRIVKLEHAQASTVQLQLEGVFGGGQRGGRRGRSGAGTMPPVIVADDPNNALIVRACPADFSAIERLISQLDSADAGAKPIKLIPLQYTDAEEMRTILEEYLRKPGASGGGGRRGRRSGGAGDLIGDVRISVSAQSNTLIVSGNAEQLEEIGEIVAQIDVESEGGCVQILRLQHAMASEIQPQLIELFEQRRGGRSGRGSSGAMPPVIVANDATNSLMVRANAADFNAIERLVAQLDDEEFSPEDIRIVQVAPGINVQDMAIMLEESFNASAPRGGGRRGGTQRAQLIITPDTRTNSVMLAGAPGLFDKVEATIRKYEEMSPKGGQVTRIIRTKNIDVNEVEGVLQDITEDNSSKRGRSSGRRSRPRGGGRRGR